MKLTPNVADVGRLPRRPRQAGADALSLINTLRAMAIDPRTGRPWLGAGQGGLSGPAVRPVALEMTSQVAARTQIPIVGMGGIQSGRDALDFLQAGATCVAVGTESFRDPARGVRIRDELAQQLREHRAWTRRARDRLPR